MVFLIIYLENWQKKLRLNLDLYYLKWFFKLHIWIQHLENPSEALIAQKLATKLVILINCCRILTGKYHEKSFQKISLKTTPIINLSMQPPSVDKGAGADDIPNHERGAWSRSFVPNFEEHEPYGVSNLKSILFKRHERVQV